MWRSISLNLHMSESEEVQYLVDGISSPGSNLTLLPRNHVFVVNHFLPVHFRFLD